MGNILVIGSLNYDIAIMTERLPAAGETIIGKSIRYGCGGKGGNQAAACARAGASTTILGAVGSDEYAEKLRASLNLDGVDTQNILNIPNSSSGIAAITVDAAGKNSIIVIPGANSRLTCEALEAQKELFVTADVILLQLEIPLDTVGAAMRLGKENSCKIVLNPAPSQVLPQSLLALADYITPNENELGQLVPGRGSLEEKSAKLIDLGAKQVIVTLGEHGALHMDQQKSAFTYPARQVSAIDTVGAGDCFNGYFCAAIAGGSPVSNAIRSAIVAASICVSRSGAQESIPDREEVLRIIRRENLHV